MSLITISERYGIFFYSLVYFYIYFYIFITVLYYIYTIYYVFILIKYQDISYINIWLVYKILKRKWSTFICKTKKCFVIFKI